MVTQAGVVPTMLLAVVALSFENLEFGNSSTRTLHLQNNGSAEIRVEVRVGRSLSCDSLGSLGIQVLQQGQEWEVKVDDAVICWRRDQTPGERASAWTSWYRVELANNENRVVTL